MNKNTLGSGSQPGSQAEKLPQDDLKWNETGIQK